MRTENHAELGGLLRGWRRSRRLTQEQLALEAEVSTRHLSCIETGKATPSREMLLLLAGVLDLPLRERNALLSAAGYAPAYRQTPFDAPEMAPVRKAASFLLERHEPYGAVVVDSAWNLLMANSAAGRLFAPLLGSASPPSNLLELLLAPGPVRTLILNWEEVVQATLHRTRWEAAAQGPEGPAAEILAKVLALPGLPEGAPALEGQLLLPLVLKLGPERLRFFTTVTTLGTPADVTAQELRIEAWFPADEATEAWSRRT